MTEGIKIDISLMNSAKEDEKDGDVDVKVKIAPNKTEDEVEVTFDKTKYELPIQKNSKILAKYISAAMHYATVDDIKGEMEDKTVHHEFSNKSIKASERKQSNKYQPFVTKWEAGDIKMATSEQKTRARHAEGQPEPLAKLIIGTVGTYRSNILNDLKALFEKNSTPRQLFLDLYSNMPTPFNTALSGLLNRSGLTQAEIKTVFQGYEIHHVIPANFLWDNDTIAELFSQGNIQFGYNDLDNLTYIPASNHREDNQWCHDDHDEAIADLIDTRVKPLVDTERYDAALDALKGIISEVRQLFKDEVLKLNGKTLDKLL